MLSLCRCGCGQEVNDLKNKFLRGHNSRVKSNQEKIKKTCFEKYGMKNPMNVDSYKIKKQKTMIKRYGGSETVFCNNLQEKQLDTLRRHYGFDYYKELLEFGGEEIRSCENFLEIKCRYCKKWIKPSRSQISERCRVIKNQLKGDNYNYIFCDKNCKRLFFKDRIYWNSGISLSDEIKEKISKSNKGNGRPVGIPMTEETKRKISLKLKGRKHTIPVTEETKKKLRIYKIKQIENQLLNNEPIIPTVGFKERPFLNELQKHCKYKILRQDPSFRYIIGRFPDGYVKELKLFILFDESSHFVDKECTILNEASLQESKDYESIQDHKLFRVSEKEWLEKSKKIISRFEMEIK